MVDRISLEVADGELFVLLGTSGSGKSTILRLIAGLSQADGGTITLHGRDVTYVSPQQRVTSFVFQNYSIFRHMSVAQNIEFGGGDERLRQKDFRRWSRRTNRLGETVIKILERASIPVMIVKKEKPRIERILVCVAISEAGKTDVRVGGRLAHQLNAAVTLLYVTKETEQVSECLRGYLERGVATLRGLGCFG